MFIFFVICMVGERDWCMKLGGVCSCFSSGKGNEKKNELSNCSLGIKSIAKIQVFHTAFALLKI